MTTRGALKLIAPSFGLSVHFYFAHLVDDGDDAGKIRHVTRREWLAGPVREHLGRR
jgi:hypothetical protein